MSRKLHMKPRVCFLFLLEGTVLYARSGSLTVQWRSQLIFYFQIYNGICRILQNKIKTGLTIIRVFIGERGSLAVEHFWKIVGFGSPPFLVFKIKMISYMHIVVFFPANKLVHIQNHHRFCPSNFPRVGLILFYLIRLLSDLTSKTGTLDGLHLSLCSLEGVCLEGFRSPSTLGFDAWPVRIIFELGRLSSPRLHWCHLHPTSRPKKLTTDQLPNKMMQLTKL